MIPADHRIISRIADITRLGATLAAVGVVAIAALAAFAADDLYRLAKRATKRKPKRLSDRQVRRRFAAIEARWDDKPKRYVIDRSNTRWDLINRKETGNGHRY